MRFTKAARSFSALILFFSSALNPLVETGLAFSPVLLPAVGKSQICPTLDFTTYWLPKYLLMVFALAGDSTITKDLLICLPKI